MFINIKIGTAKLKTDKTAKLLGGTKGKTYEKSKTAAATEFSTKMILLKKLSFFINKIEELLPRFK